MGIIAPNPQSSERRCRRRPIIVTTGRCRRQGCAVPPILRQTSLCSVHHKIGSPTPRWRGRSCGPVTPAPPDRQAAPRHQQTDGGSHANADRTHPGMARGPCQDPSGDRSTWHARGTATGSQAVPQAQAAMGRVSGDGAALPPRYRHVLGGIHDCAVADRAMTTAITRASFRRQAPGPVETHRHWP